MEQNKEMKDVVSRFIAELSKKGVKVNSAAILNLNDAPKNEALTNAGIEKAIKSTLERLKKFSPSKPGEEKSEPLPEQKEKELSKEQCFCPNCFNYDTFEYMLNMETGVKKFHYREIDVDGVIFKIKVCNSESRGYDIMIQQKEVKPEVFTVDPSWTVEQLTEGLSTAVRNKDFDKAQAFINALNQNKNQ